MPDAFLAMVLITSIRHMLQRTFCHRHEKVDRNPSLLLFLSNMNCFIDSPIHFIAFSVNDLGLITIYDMVESDEVICNC